MDQSNLKPPAGAKHKKKRVGCGDGSGHGSFSGRGCKGQKSRSGSGGYQRLGMRRLVLSTPKLRGFRSSKPKAQVVHLKDLETIFVAQDIVTPRVLYKKGLILSAEMPVKILVGGELTKALTIKHCLVSRTATEKIIAVGGQVHA